MDRGQLPVAPDLGERGQVGTRIVVEHPRGPMDGGGRVRVEPGGVDGPDGGPVVVPHHRSGAELLEPADHLVRLRSVADDVAQDPDLVDLGQVVAHRVEGSEIGVDVRQDR